MASSRGARILGPEPKELRDFLQDCKTDWGPRELRAALQKLRAVGVTDVEELLSRTEQGCLNDDLAAVGERRFAHDTLELFRLAATSEARAEAAARVHAFDELLDAMFGHSVDDMSDADILDEAALQQAQRQGRNSERLYSDARADMARVAAKISSARKQRENGRFSIYNNASPPADLGAPRSFHPSSASSQPRKFGRAPAPQPPTATSLPSQPQGSARRGASKSSAQVPNWYTAEEYPRCARAEQSGFMFGSHREANAPPRGAASTPPQQQQRQQPQRRRFGSALQDAVHQQLMAVAGCSDAEKRAHVKRLLVRWHPDRNPDDVETSTAMFQFIQQEKDALLGT